MKLVKVKVESTLLFNRRWQSFFALGFSGGISKIFLANEKWKRTK